MKSLRKVYIFLLLTFPFFCFAAVGHLAITVNKLDQTLPVNQAQTAIAQALVGLETKIPEGSGVFTKIDQPSFAYGDSAQNSFAFLGYGNNNQNGIYLFQNNNIKKIADTKTDIPAGTAFFEQFDEPSFDVDLGGVAFIGSGFLGQKGIYFFDGKTLSKMADQQDLVPEGSGKFTDFSDIDLSGQNLVFRGTDENELVGIYLYTKTGVYKIADAKDKIEKHGISDLHIIPNSFGADQLTVQVDFSDNSSSLYLMKLKFVPY